MNQNDYDLTQLQSYEVARIQYPRILDNEPLQALLWHEESTWHVLAKGDHAPTQWNTINVGGLVVIEILDQSFMQSVNVGDILMLYGDGSPYSVIIEETDETPMIFKIRYDMWDNGNCIYKYVWSNGIVTSLSYDPYDPKPLWLRPANNEVQNESE